MCFAPPHLPFSSCPAGVPKHLPWVAVWKDESSIPVKWGMAGSAGPDREWWHAFPVQSVWSQVIVLGKPWGWGWKVSDSLLTTCWIVSLFEQPLPCKHQWVLKDSHFWKAMGQSTFGSTQQYQFDTSTSMTPPPTAFPHSVEGHTAHASSRRPEHMTAVIPIANHIYSFSLIKLFCRL